MPQDAFDTHICVGGCTGGAVVRTSCGGLQGVCSRLCVRVWVASALATAPYVRHRRPHPFLSSSTFSSAIISSASPLQHILPLVSARLLFIPPRLTLICLLTILLHVHNHLPPPPHRPLLPHPPHPLPSSPLRVLLTILYNPTTELLPPHHPHRPSFSAVSSTSPPRPPPWLDRCPRTCSHPSSHTHTQCVRPPSLPPPPQQTPSASQITEPLLLLLPSHPPTKPPKRCELQATRGRG